MKCQIPFSGDYKKNVTNLSSAEYAQTVVMVHLIFPQKKKMLWVLIRSASVRSFLSISTFVMEKYYSVNKKNKKKNNLSRALYYALLQSVLKKNEYTFKEDNSCLNDFISLFLKGNNLSKRRAISFLLELTPFQKGLRTQTGGYKCCLLEANLGRKNTKYIRDYAQHEIAGKRNLIGATYICASKLSSHAS